MKYQSIVDDTQASEKIHIFHHETPSGPEYTSGWGREDKAMLVAAPTKDKAELSVKSPNLHSAPALQAFFTRNVFISYKTRSQCLKVKKNRKSLGKEDFLGDKMIYSNHKIVYFI